VRAPPVDFVPSPELYAPVEGCHRRPPLNRHMRLLQMVSELWRLLQVVVKRLSQRPQPANPLVLRRRKPHEPLVKQFSAPRTSPRLIARTCSRSKCRICPRTLFAMVTSNLPFGQRLAPILHPPAVASVVDGPHRPSQRSRPIFSSAFAPAKGSAYVERALSSLY